jgi:hypothetical protein
VLGVRGMLTIRHQNRQLIVHSNPADSRDTSRASLQFDELLGPIPERDPEPCSCTFSS